MIPRFDIEYKSADICGISKNNKGKWAKYSSFAELIRLIKEADDIFNGTCGEEPYKLIDSWRAEVKKVGIEL